MCNGVCCGSTESCIDNVCCAPHLINICNPYSNTCSYKKTVCSGTDACTTANQLTTCGGCTNGQVPCPNNDSCCSPDLCIDGSCCPQGKMCNGVCCGTGQECISNECISNNQPPYANNLAVDVAPYCSYSLTGIPASGLTTFKWNYHDAENDPQSMWQIQINTTNNFDGAKVFDSGVMKGSANKVMLPVLLASANTSSPHIKYGLKYYWRVKVWETVNGQWSSWAYFADAATTPKNTFIYPYSHPQPMVSYAISPDNIEPTKPVTFTDNSICYKDDGTSYSCNTETANTYGWWFTNNKNPLSDDQTKGNPPNQTYVTGAYPTKLQICDSIDCCSATKNIRVGTHNTNIPTWKEISPWTNQ